LDTYKLGKIIWRLRLRRCSLPGASTRRGLSSPVLVLMLL
jgi:hypothetical protein